MRTQSQRIVHQTRGFPLEVTVCSMTMLLASVFVGLFVALDLAVTWANYAALLTLSGLHAAVTATLRLQTMPPRCWHPPSRSSKLRVNRSAGATRRML